MQLKQPNLKNFLQKDDSKLEKVTPMMAQYLECKQRHQEYLLFYRMGDFYELFFEDAKVASRELGIALTKRGKYKGKEIPMCGVPYHSSQNYLSRLIKAGFKVAVAEQLETLKDDKNHEKQNKIFPRDVVRIITPGTILEESLLEPAKNNYLLSVFWDENQISISWVDITTSEFRIRRFSKDSNYENLEEMLFKIDPEEIILCEDIQDENLKKFFTGWQKKITNIPQAFFDVRNCIDRIKFFFNTDNLDSLGEISDLDLSSLGSIVEYMQITQKNFIPNLSKLIIETDNDFLIVDKISMQSLEIFQKINGDKNGSLLKTIDQTISAGGSRLIIEHIKNPLTDKTLINKRLNCVSYFFNNIDLMHQIRLNLNGIPDVERSLARLSANLNNPRDCLNISNFIQKSLIINSLIEKHPQGDVKDYLTSNQTKCRFNDLSDKIKKAVIEDGPNNIVNGGFVKDGYSDRLDNLRSIKLSLKKEILNLQLEYSNLVGINTLKIKFNNFHGYFVEVTNKNLQKLIDQETTKFDLIQTTKNVSRFQTDILKEKSVKIQNSDAESIELEKIIFEELKSKVLLLFKELKELSYKIYFIDVMLSHAFLSEKNNYVKPEFNKKNGIEIINGRHPVVESSLTNAGKNFIPNSCVLEREATWLMTGPNMAGKSTFLRQTAIMIIMAQIGCYIPAEKANLSIVDKIFTRVGASDDLSQGQSTFMTEMVETARILNGSTENSLVILDEVGRGTSASDGMALAWAILDFIVKEIKCLTLFATHYHKLTELFETNSQIKLKTLKSKEWGDEIVFLYKVVDGVSLTSFGLHVAKIAGINEKVIFNAKKLIKLIENGEIFKKNLIEDGRKKEVSELKTFREIKNTLENLELDDITPKESQQILYSLKSLFKP